MARLTRVKKHVPTTAKRMLPMSLKGLTGGRLPKRAHPPTYNICSAAGMWAQLKAQGGGLDRGRKRQSVAQAASGSAGLGKGRPGSPPSAPSIAASMGRNGPASLGPRSSAAPASALTSSLHQQP